MMTKKQLAISCLGNALEWFDYGLLIYLAPVLGSVFFPTHNTHSATLAAFGVFAAGFICRPLGGIVMGHFGDRLGRATTLRFSILSIALCTLLIGFLPSFSVIGWTAPVTFTVLRLVQGLSVGGEYGGIMIYLAESAPQKKRGFFTSFAATGANLGFLTATLAILFLHTRFTPTAIQLWAWRLPFIANGLAGFLIFYNRMQLLETPTFLDLQENQKIEKTPLLLALRRYPKHLLQIFGLSAMGAGCYYVFFGYMAHTITEQFQIPNATYLKYQAGFLAAMLILVPLSALAGDKWGRRNVLLITALGLLVLIIPGFIWLKQGSLVSIVCVMSAATLFSSLEQGNTLSTVVELCPASIRYSGISFAYNLGNTIFGGTAPLVTLCLVPLGGFLAPAYYLMGLTLITGIALLGIRTIAYE